MTPPSRTYTLSLHDALPISLGEIVHRLEPEGFGEPSSCRSRPGVRSEEHTSELQSRFDLVCRLLLEKKKTKISADAPMTLPSRMILFQTVALPSKSADSYTH